MRSSIVRLAPAAGIAIAITAASATSAQASVPRSYTDALAQAKSYVRVLDISKAGLFDQLTSEFGGKFTKAQATYALRHVKVNYNKEALAAAKSYEKLLHLSDDALYDQLTSEFGAKFTSAQAQYAIDHL